LETSKNAAGGREVGSGQAGPINQPRARPWD